MNIILSGLPPRLVVENLPSQAKIDQLPHLLVQMWLTGQIFLRGLGKNFAVAEIQPMFSDVIVSVVKNHQLRSGPISAEIIMPGESENERLDCVKEVASPWIHTG